MTHSDSAAAGPLAHAPVAGDAQEAVDAPSGAGPTATATHPSTGTVDAPEGDRLALDLLLATARFSRTLGRVPGVQYSTVAWRVLAELSAAPARISVLAQQQRVAQPTMTELVQRLEGEGWLVRGADPDDGRATLVSVTPAGRGALADYRRTAAAAVDPHLAQLSAGDRATLARAVELIRHLTDGVGNPSG
ncbi:MarR family winged helix-turn-helix transcriptional regulator [Leucobacter luti]|uniref:MarR family winged helix-turn-helix transcriptional regulator n=1 Tax=Leucobacter luti TaxID=340320 RepID=UPI001F53E94A|nr:MarR family winged helix-turn-helix transcriptional regulator [Leucobacter luti]